MGIWKKENVDEMLETTDIIAAREAKALKETSSKIKEAVSSAASGAKGVM